MEAEQAIRKQVERYFDGLYRGDAGLLREVFHPRAALSGVVKGEPYHRELEDYLAVVARRASPESLGEPRRMSVLSLETLGSIAIAKAHCPMLGFNYVDALSLLHEGDEWRIIHKLFTHVPE